MGGSDSGQGQKEKTQVENIFFYSAYLAQPVLRQSMLVHDDTVDGDYFATMIKETMTVYHIKPETQGGLVLGGCTDNTNVMPAALKKAGLASFPCNAHSFNLILQTLLLNLAIVPLLEALNSFFSPAAGLTSLAEDAGL